MYWKAFLLVQVVASLVASRITIFSTLLSGEAESKDEETIKTFSFTLSFLSFFFFEKEVYTLDQIFNFDETSLYEMRMPPQTFRV